MKKNTSNKKETSELADGSKRLLEKEYATPSMYICDIAKRFGLAIRNEAGGGLSSANKKILMCLVKNDGISQNNIMKATKLSAPTVSVNLARMEAEGLIKRRRDLKDQRQESVYITEEGRRRNELISTHHSRAEKEMMKGISEEERIQLNTLLKKLLKNMIDYEEKTK